MDGCFSRAVKGCSLGVWNERRVTNSDGSGAVWREEFCEVESFLQVRTLNGLLWKEAHYSPLAIAGNSSPLSTGKLRTLPPVSSFQPEGKMLFTLTDPTF